MAETLSIDAFLASTVRALRSGETAGWSLQPQIELTEVWERIEFHGIAFLLHDRSSDLVNWPEQITSKIGEEARLMVLWESTHHRAVATLVQELRRADIPSVLMKGTALAYSLHSDPATRRRGDTDLLVEPMHKQRTRAVLKDLGWYRRDDPHGLYYQEGWMHDAAGFFQHSIDLHWEPSDRPVLQDILPTQAFFESKEAIPRFCEGAFRPSLPIMMLHATINQKWHAVHGYLAEAGRVVSPRRLIWSIDFDLITQAMTDREWQWLLAHCARHKVGPLVAESLRGMSQDLDSPIPEGTLDALEAHPINATLAYYLSEHDNLRQFWIDLRKAQSLGDRLRLIGMRAFPPREHLMSKYPGARSWPTPFLQARLLAETAGKAVRKAIN